MMLAGEELVNQRSGSDASIRTDEIKPWQTMANRQTILIPLGLWVCTLHIFAYWLLALGACIQDMKAAMQNCNAGKALALVATRSP